ncbi:RlpA-like double-psi beta-barrel domain [Phytophthora cinnamomi]|uniref:RlpA-like double-psi beta-barrel domain n=1 Tax=Phytophthora cinnamomi TaxID=4785 RepID=UPI003559ED8A|nr:RlpA-like double-psi beta-barrel domain [Phytophthora cinnamomi]
MAPTYRTSLQLAILLAVHCNCIATAYEGYGTVYTLSSPSDGNCNFMSWPDDAVTKYAALNAEQWEETMNCGRCAQVSCTDASCAGQASEIVYIMDQCPGCAYGDLDLSPDVFESITGQSYTKLSIEWQFVDCPISSSVQYCLKTGSSEFWVAVQPANFVSGVQSLSINGQETSVIDSAYYFLIDGSGESVADLSSVSISLTGVNGEVLEETLSLTADECTDGSKQFATSDSAQSTILAGTSNSADHDAAGYAKTSQISAASGSSTVQAAVTAEPSAVQAPTAASTPGSVVQSNEESSGGSSSTPLMIGMIVLVCAAVMIAVGLAVYVRRRRQQIDSYKRREEQGTAMCDDDTSPRASDVPSAYDVVHSPTVHFSSMESMGWVALVSASTTYEGYGTVYTLSSPSDGNCNFMSWPDDAVTKYAALNAEQWEETMNCGRCAQVSCTDASCAGQASEIVYIMDQCPGCAYGDLDLSPDVFESITGQSYTKLSIEWQFVDCPISSSVQYCLKTGSSEFWVAVQPANFVSGVQSLSINGQETSVIDSAYYFLIDGSGESVADLSSVSISLSGVNGEVLEETLSLTADKCTNGNSQFSSSGDNSQTTTTTTQTATTSAPTTAAPTTTPTPTTPAPTTAAPITAAPTPTPTPTTAAPTEAPSTAPTSTTVQSETSTSAPTPTSTPSATEASVQEEASSSGGLHSTAAIVGLIAAVCVALGAAVGVAMAVHKKRKLLEASKNAEDRDSMASYVSIRTPRSEVPVMHSVV